MCYYRKKTDVDQNKRQETGMIKSSRWRIAIAIAISALSIIFVSAALAG